MAFAAGRRLAVALVGGDEFTDPAVSLDRQLLALAAGSPAVVAILPTAAEQENPRLAAANGVKHFKRLGARAYPVMVRDRQTANDQRVVDELRGASMIYLTGGDPRHLVASLKDSLAWSRIVELGQSGVVVAGSSAGAMALCESMRFGASQLDGLGLVRGVSVLPHFESRSDASVRELQAGLSDDARILALDGATGCFFHGDQWMVAGPGRVQIISRLEVEVLTHGDTFAIL